jgi:hypothetical protein
MSKYGRHQSMINRTSDESIGEDNWLKQLAKTLEKSAVQPKSVDSSMFDQINSIMNSKSKYPSVAAAVEDMKERSGLKAYLDKLSANKAVKKASDENNAFIKQVTPKVSCLLSLKSALKLKLHLRIMLERTKEIFQYQPLLTRLDLFINLMFPMLKIGIMMI